jgi:hypothetical protein
MARVREIREIEDREKGKGKREKKIENRRA